jgi:hypothetical protein
VRLAARLGSVACLVVIVAGCSAGAATEAPDALPPGQYDPIDVPDIELPAARGEMRDAALRHARVWRAPDRPIATAALDRSAAPWRTDGASGTLTCRFLPSDVHGTSGKFDCVLPDRQRIKVKYDASGEVPAEIAASRLLRALGFGADEVDLVRRVRCFGCPRYPFLTFKVLEWVALRDRYVRRIDYNDPADFEWVSVERRAAEPELKVEGREKGWSWFELRAIDPRLGGASRAEIDGLRLMAMFLGHWDNKAENQRLVCLGGWNDTAGCVEPFAFIQDAGATFGPKKVNLARWRATPIWADRRRCLVSMTDMPFHGATFEDAAISEAGRTRLAAQLASISDAQVHDLFSAARFPEFDGARDREADLARWTAAFREKVRQISTGPACPP